MTLTEFLLARIAEDEADADCEGSGEYASCRDWSERRLAECAAKRSIVEDCESDGSQGPSEYALSDMVFCRLALPYRDHPDYRPEEWKP